MTEHQKDTAHVAELVDRAQISMFTTMTAEGKHVSRPMALQEAEINQNPQVNVAFSNSKSSEWTSAEYWESPSSKVVRLLGAARAAVTGDSEKFPGENRTVSL